jgi:hypothetical protein
MARKDRAPTPPKRPQAPQRRSTPSKPGEGGNRRLLYLLAASGLVALAVVLGVIFLAGGDDTDVAATMEAAGCKMEVVPAQVGDHTAELDATDDPKWNTDPPTSGPHYPTSAVYGEYDTPLKPAQVVHNLEHGAVFMLYGDDVPENVVGQLQQLYGDDPIGMLLAPYPKLGDKIALGAWTVPDDFEPGGTNGTAYLATCERFDEDAFTTFRDELRFRGPERFSPDQLHPGNT